MIVDDVEDDADPERVGAIDEAAQIVGLAVKPRRREQRHAVVTPAEAAGEIRDRHHLDDGDAELGEERQFVARRRATCLRGVNVPTCIS